MKRNYRNDSTGFPDFYMPSSRVKRGRTTSIFISFTIIITFSLIFFLWIWLKDGLSSHGKKPVRDWLVPQNEMHINPHPYQFIINRKDACGSATLNLLVAVASSPSHFDRRDAIRQTWARHKHGRVRVLFFLGLPSDVTIQQRIETESEKYKDVIQEDFIDAYVNLTLKTVMALRWTALFCPRAEHFFKTDDDVFVNLGRLIEHVQHEAKPKWILGCIKQKKSPSPISLNGAPVPNFGHPPFVAGAGYVISGDLVVPLFRASLRTPYLPVEDVFITAHCARALGVHPQHHDGFTCGERLQNDCHVTRHFTAHHVTPDKQHVLWKLVSDPQRPCDVTN